MRSQFPDGGGYVDSALMPQEGIFWGSFGGEFGVSMRLLLFKQISSSLRQDVGDAGWGEHLVHDSVRVTVKNLL